MAAPTIAIDFPKTVEGQNIWGPDQAVERKESRTATAECQPNLAGQSMEGVISPRASTSLLPKLYRIQVVMECGIKASREVMPLWVCESEG